MPKIEIGKVIDEAPAVLEFLSTNGPGAPIPDAGRFRHVKSSEAKKIPEWRFFHFENPYIYRSLTRHAI